MKIKLSIIIVFLICGFSFAEKIVSDAEMDSLKNDADAVMLSDMNVCKITGENKARITRNGKVLIRDKKGESYCGVLLTESPFISVNNIKAAIRDTSGNLIKELNDDDIQKNTLSPGFMLYQENRNIYFQLRHMDYPYIFEFSYDLDIKSLFFWPAWHPQRDIPSLASSYKLILDKPVKFHTYSIGMDITSVKRVENRDSVYLWQAENIPARTIEDFLPPENELQMALLFAPENFKLSKSEGSFTDWDQVAAWCRPLYYDKFVLPEDIREEIRSRVTGINDELEKIQILYKYLQEKTHYVFISIGIGGWEPQPAASTYMNCYGDCKALSTLMVAMLDVVGIKGYPALALTRDEGIVYEDFPSNQFNHVIAFVPMEKDTLWLECTADFYDITDRPYTIEDINALVIKEDRGELIRTPVAPSSCNRWTSFTTAEIKNLNTLCVESRVRTSGQQKRFFKSLFENLKKEDEKIVLQKYFTDYVPNLVIDDYTFEEIGSADKTVVVNFKGQYKKAFSRSGKRLFITPSLFNQKTKDNLPKEEIRSYDIRFLYPYQDSDTIRIKLPSYFVLEAAPEMIEIDNAFARYKTEYTFEDNTLNYIRHFEYKTIHFPKEMYAEFLEFLKKVVKTDQTKFVFRTG